MMNYNIHPIFVHFPIALLFIYSLIKIFPVKKWIPSVEWRDIERVLLVVGVFGAFAALATGDTAEHMFKANRQIVEIHSTFAGIATFLYGALLLGEIAFWVKNNFLQKIEKNNILNKTVNLIDKVLCNKSFSTVLSILALIAIFVTGILGGAIVYGASADPFAGIILRLFGINL